MNTYSQDVIDEVNKIDIVKYVGKYVGLEKKSNLYVGLCPFHEEKTPSFTLYPETNSFYCWGCGASGTVIDFVKKYHHLGFVQAITYLLDYSRIDPNNIQSKPSIMTFLQQYNKKQSQDKYVPHVILPYDVMNQYEESPIYEWLEEGIQQEIMDKYQVRYNSKDNRAVFPIFNSEGKIIAVKGRTLYDNFKKLGLRKYTYYQKLGELDFLYGLSFNKDDIEQHNECICVEGEKSLWKLEGWGIKNAVAICTHNINPLQIKCLLKLKTDITIAFDKDVKMDEIREICQKLKLFTNVFVVYDNNKLLKEKDSPCDEGNDIWNKLYSERIRL